MIGFAIWLAGLIVFAWVWAMIGLPVYRLGYRTFYEHQRRFREHDAAHDAALGMATACAVLWPVGYPVVLARRWATPVPPTRAEEVAKERARVEAEERDARQHREAQETARLRQEYERLDMQIRAMKPPELEPRKDNDDG